MFGRVLAVVMLGGWMGWVQADDRVPGARGGKGKAKPPVAEASLFGPKVVEFSKQRLGQQVGDGQCAALATEALRAAGARGRGPDEPNSGDYTWGERIFTLEASPSGPKPTGPPSAIQPGDIVQFRDTKWVTRSGRRTTTMTFGHHTAIVQAVESEGAVLKILHQNFGGKKEVMEGTLTLASLTEGWIRVYRPAAPRR